MGIALTVSKLQRMWFSCGNVCWRGNTSWQKDEDNHDILCISSPAIEDKHDAIIKDALHTWLVFTNGIYGKVITWYLITIWILAVILFKGLKGNLIFQFKIKTLITEDAKQCGPKEEDIGSLDRMS